MRKESAKRIVALLSDANALAQSKPVVRARAGDRLSQLGDPRFDAQRYFLPVDQNLGFVKILEDKNFKIGTRKKDEDRVARIIGYKVGDDEFNDDPTPTNEFYLARYPVTVAQFRVFVEHQKFTVKDDDVLRDPDTRPVRRVSWHEAKEYCRWLTQRFMDDAVLNRTQIAAWMRERNGSITLPSELEWEKAARGAANTIYPWGDTPDSNKANTRESAVSDTSTVSDTSAVGCFPAYSGLHDMIGNVWEWTSSEYGKSHGLNPVISAGEFEGKDVSLMVLRGGSWYVNRDYARCAYRLGRLPDARSYYMGFRVVLRFAHVLPPLLLVSPQGEMARRYTRTGCVPAMRADARKCVCPPRRRKKNSAGQVWSARTP